jgi:hypothetical protein
MGRRAVFAGLLVAISVAGCGGDEGSGEESWAGEVDEVVSLLVDAYDLADAYQMARFFSAGGTLDLTIWGRGVAATPEAVVQAVQRLWFFDAGFAEVDAAHVFVSPDSAVIWWWAFDRDLGGGQYWAQHYSFGAGGRTASRAFRGIETSVEDLFDYSLAEQAVLAVYDRYVAAWQTKDPEALAGVYADDVTVRDDVRDEVWRGVDEMVADLDEAAPLAAGPWPRVFVYESGADVQAIVLVQLEGQCPMLEARRWVLSGDTIVREVRFTHVPSARRCLSGLPDGWWTTFELPAELQDNVTEVLDVAGSLVELVNAEPIHEEFTRWMFSTYAESGIGIPEVSAVWFPPSPECTELGGLAIESDERYSGRHTVVVCFAEDRLTSDTSESGWFETAAAYGLHELAHIWMVDHLTDEIRAAFNEQAGLTVWRGPEAIWRERGVEHGAFTIPWGLMGANDARYPIFPPPECEELTARYELITGREPLTPCGEDGWSP